MTDKTLHLDGTIGDDSPKTEQEINDAVSEGVDAVLDGREPGDEEEGGNKGEESGETKQKPEEKAGQEGGEGEKKGEGELTRNDGESEEDFVVRKAEAEKSSDGEGDKEKEKEKEVSPDYTVPDGLGEKSTGRFTSLVDDNKALRVANEQQAETLNGMRQMVSESGLTNNEFIGAVDFAATVKRDPAEGLKLMQKYMKQISVNTGTKIPEMEVDMLEGFPDLREQVEDMKLTEENALELAKTRRADKVAQNAEKASKEDASAREEYNTAMETAIPKMAGYLAELSKNDIDWAAKSPFMVKAATFARENIHPSGWMSHMESEYNKITEIAASVGGKKRTETPITGTGEGRGGTKEPQTIGEAIDQLL